MRRLSAPRRRRNSARLLCCIVVTLRAALRYYRLATNTWTLPVVSAAAAGHLLLKRESGVPASECMIAFERLRFVFYFYSSCTLLM